MFQLGGTVISVSGGRIKGGWKIFSRDVKRLLLYAKCREMHSVHGFYGVGSFNHLTENGCF